ncbi:MAG: cupin domain-containing protein [Planctomycetes bacterium]|nr:cupin domain-containing protein [Planctomycetota bacterium]MCC7173224.1 cupin domain-containing protein [Planctomycetota bacterium]
MDPIDPTTRVAFAPEKLTKTNLFDSPRMFLDVYGLLPGQAQKPHAHADADKFYLALEGSGLVTIGSREVRLERGHVVVCPAGEDHGVRNDTDANLVLLVSMTKAH